MERVLVVQGEHLLAEGITSLLSHEIDLSVVTITYISSTALIDQIDEFQPSVLILDEMDDFADCYTLTGILKNCPQVRLIIIDKWQNRLHIYDKHEVVIARSAALLAGS